MTAEAACEALETALRDISAAALNATCGKCWAFAGQSCDTPYPGGTHAARLARAARKGLITSADLMLVLDTLDAFTAATVLYAAEAVPV